jgi:ureidoglycolate lyase
MDAPVTTLRVEALTPEAFRPFGDVIEARSSAQQFAINQGFATRFHDLAQLDVAEAGGRALINIFRAVARTLPLHLRVMERHPLGSQAFVAMSELPFLVVVAAPAPVLDVQTIRCFLARSGQGVNYARGTWHHPLIALQRPSDFLVLDRGGLPHDHNLDEVDVRAAQLWIPALDSATT